MSKGVTYVHSYNMIYMNIYIYILIYDDICICIPIGCPNILLAGLSIPYSSYILATKKKVTFGDQKRTILTSHDEPQVGDVPLRLPVAKHVKLSATCPAE